MAYTDLASLATDSTFLGRISQAIMKFAVYQQGAGTVYQKTWAAMAVLNPLGVAQSIVQQLLQNPTITAQLGAIADVDLQSAVETLLNNIINGTTAYVWEAQTATSFSFLQRIQVAITTFCAYIFNEVPGTANHSARYNWAKYAMLNPTQIAQQIAPAVALDPNVAPNLNFSTDAQIQSATETQCNTLLLS
jgi:hypothetical protein